jgi:hypothetical protein
MTQPARDDDFGERSERFFALINVVIGGALVAYGLLEAVGGNPLALLLCIVVGSVPLLVGASRWYVADQTKRDLRERP